LQTAQCRLKKLILLFCTLSNLVFSIEESLLSPPQAGTIIIINGPSAAGKKSIQNELQKIFMPLYLKIGIDTFFDALIATPDLSDFEKTKEFSQYTNNGQLIRRVRLTHDVEGHPVVPLEIGLAGDKIIFGMHAALAAYAEQGNNVLVDYILYKPEWLSNLVAALKNNKVYFIGLKIPWEQSRAGSSPAPSNLITQ